MKLNKNCYLVNNLLTMNFVSTYYKFLFNDFDYLDENAVLEKQPLENLARDGQLMAYKHDGFWQPMDTYREMVMLTEMWNSGSAPWSIK